MSHLLQCTRGIWITKVGVSLRFLQLPIHLQQLEGIKSHIILGAWSALVSWLFIPPDTLYPSTSAGKFFPSPLLRAKREVLERGGYNDLKGKISFPSESSPHTDADSAERDATIKRQKPSERKLRPFQESFTDKMIQDHTQQVARCHFPLNPSMRGF